MAGIEDIVFKEDGTQAPISEPKGGEEQKPLVTQTPTNDNGKTDGSVEQKPKEGDKGEEKVEGKNDSNSSSTGGLEEGTIVEYNGTEYKIDASGNLIDKDGKVFKKAEEVQKFLTDNKAVDEDEVERTLMENIKKAVGVDITDDKGNVVEFSDDPEGISNYVKSVVELKTSEIENAVVNKIYRDNPLVKQFIDYVQITGSPKGFGDIPDRSGIELDPKNEMQLEAVIRMAATEFGNKSLNESYIKYLKDTGALYEEAKIQLEALIGKDEAYRRDIEMKAELARQQEERKIENYWKGVLNAINNRVIGKYKLPETFIKEIDGKKVSLTPNDFYKYVSETALRDENGDRITAYQRDLRAQTNEELLNKDLLDAWLLFTGGSYKDLVDMAIKEEKVKRLIIKSQEKRTNPSIKINRHKDTSSDKLSDIVFKD